MLFRAHIQVTKVVREYRSHSGASDKCSVFWQDAPAITKAALESNDDLAVEAVDMFLAIIGAEAGYMGLRALATGGVYICGGITPKVCIMRMVTNNQCHSFSIVSTAVCKVWTLLCVHARRTGRWCNSRWTMQQSVSLH